jgi:hypothetical protein
MSIADIARKAGKLAIDHSPTILTSVGVAGVITTAFLAGKASFQAADVIRVREEEDGYADDPKLRMRHRAELVWKLYIPAATTGFATVVCIIGANHVGGRRAASLAAATTILERSFDEYKAKVVEKLGERKEQQVHDEILQDRVRDTSVDGITIFGLVEGELCYDKFSDRYFRNTVEGIRAAENQLNYAVIHDNYASLDEFYTLLNMPSPGYSHSVGWNSDRLLEVKVGAAPMLDGIPVITMEFKNEPLPDYGRFR